MKFTYFASASLLLFALSGCGKSDSSKAGGPDTLPPIANPGAPEPPPVQTIEIGKPKPTPGKHGDTTVTASGLMYIDVKVGKGPTPKVGQNITVNYTGKLTDGKIFDSNVDPSKGHVQPFVTPIGVGKVIKGWDEGMISMKVGGKRKLIVPSDLGYGANGTPDGSIPPNATLIFDVELVKIE
ncbi:MAG: FKBP-type peptidyl-prolyl cis-trans isomerase [Bacteroidota bacterium]|nr:FKBP-type peptidyl-prolyl cis-trans isomerase [Bacteroidota bacterium]MDP4229602.1 FKBP-type peptidyl-prolyl cis-trans isomerase [Bacteroidota bacterium]MDP4236320.1 FKBP-type peptidyl-prolyl cis-trans isomerase [Bacteroidota bacterium]